MKRVLFIAICFWKHIFISFHLIYDYFFCFQGRFSIRFSIAYESLDRERGCCVSDNMYHKRCRSNDKISRKNCKLACSKDMRCKAFTIQHKNTTKTIHQCQLSTTASSCPSGYYGPNDQMNVGKLNTQSKCGDGEFGGCYIRDGKYAYIILFLYGIKESIICSLLTHQDKIRFCACRNGCTAVDEMVKLF